MCAKACGQQCQTCGVERPLMVLQALIYGLQQQLLKRKKYYESRCIPGSSEFAVKRVFICGGKLPVATGKMFSLLLLLSCSPLSCMFYPQRWAVSWWLHCWKTGQKLCSLTAWMNSYKGQCPYLYRCIDIWSKKKKLRTSYSLLLLRYICWFWCTYEVVEAWWISATSGFCLNGMWMKLGGYCASFLMLLYFQNTLIMIRSLWVSFVL